MKDFWLSLERRARIGLIASVLLILTATALIGWWALRLDYQLLFSDLRPQDAQAMVSELERQKIPYRIGDDGNSILVDRALVHSTRLKLMGRDVPLHGAVGLELFNNADFGMTEFAQKINYQRALQGEITRTIQSMDEVRDVRVLLAMPEQGLFKQATARPKASVRLTLRPGRVLRPEQVTGIQRLVAASVPGLTVQDVTIVDQQGVALTRPSGDTDGEFQTARLDLKRDTEAYLTRKASDVLDRLLGPGKALASVDVSLNMDMMKVTTEDVVPAAGRPGAQATGVIVKERETTRDTGAPLDTRVSDAGPVGRGASAQREVDYAVGRRVEQVVSQPGSIRQIQVVAALRTPMDASDLDQLKKLVAAAVGASPERGDVVIVHTLKALVPEPEQSFAKRAASAELENVESPSESELITSSGNPAYAEWLRWLAVPALLIIVGGLAFGSMRRIRRTPAVSSPSIETEREREDALAKVREWLKQETRTSRGVGA